MELHSDHTSRQPTERAWKIPTACIQCLDTLDDEHWNCPKHVEYFISPEDEGTKTFPKAGIYQLTDVKSQPPCILTTSLWDPQISRYWRPQRTLFAITSNTINEPTAKHLQKQWAAAYIKASVIIKWNSVTNFSLYSLQREVPTSD